MSVNEIRDFISENYYKRTGFSKENNYYSKEHLKKKERFIVACKQINGKIPHTRNAKEHYQSFIRKKNTKLVKQTK